MTNQRFSDAGILRTHFGRNQVAVSAPSPSGPMLDRAKLYGQLRPHDTHYTDVLPEPSDRRLRGRVEYIAVSTKYPSAPWPKVVDGEIHRSEREITAQPISESRSVSVRGPDLDMIADFGDIGKRLLAMAALPGGAVCVQALERYYGGEGDAYSNHVIDNEGAITREGVSPLVALYPLIDEGRALLESLRDSHRDKASINVNRPEWQRLTLRSAVWFGEDDIKAQLSRCARRAQELLYEAQDRWMATAVVKARRA